MRFGKDAAFARVPRAFESLYGVLSRLGEAERVDAEGPDNARVQALEVEQGDVSIEPRARIEDVAAGARASSGAPCADIGGDPTAPVQAGQVQVIEGGHRSAGPAEGEAGEPLRSTMKSTSRVRWKISRTRRQSSRL